MSTPATVNTTVQAHYTRPDLGSLILTALEKAGKDIDHLTPEDLAPIDAFHIRGRKATLELAHNRIKARLMPSQIAHSKHP